MRRYKGRFNCCYTCIEKNRNCRGGCSRYAEVPPDLICKDCANSMPSGSPPNVLFCGLQHAKPPLTDLIRELEIWVPNLNIRSLGNQLAIHSIWIDTHRVTNKPEFECGASMTRPPSSVLRNIAYDTTTGLGRPVTPSDDLMKTSKEIAYYTMQHIRVGRRTLLIFYDSGSNGHLIEGPTAEDLQLDVITDMQVPIGGIGGKVSWSNYGMYQLTLGPDINGRFHQLDLQGITTITRMIPMVELDELWNESRSVVGNNCALPVFLGGTSVSILVGIKSTALGPKLIHTLPSGLGIYESVLTDVSGSNICYGGPHHVFTQAYAKVGRTSNHIELLFSEVATAYMNAPRNFVRVDVEEHGPMMSLAREWEILEDCYRSVPGSKPVKSSTTAFSIQSEAGDEDTLEDSNRVNPVENKCETHAVCPDLPPDDLPDCVCVKAKIPLQKLKGLLDEADIDDVVDYKCDKCANCPECRMSARAKTKSLQEEYEQEVIKKSVRVDTEAKKTFVTLPFVKEPVEYLTKMHRGSSNYKQAKSVYSI